MPEWQWGFAMHIGLAREVHGVSRRMWEVLCKCRIVAVADGCVTDLSGEPRLLVCVDGVCTRRKQVRLNLAYWPRLGAGDVCGREGLGEEVGRVDVDQLALRGKRRAANSVQAASRRGYAATLIME